MDGHDRLLAAFLAGELDPAGARRWDEHLLVCERCWRAVREDRTGRQAAQLLRQPAPPGLADRVTFAVEMAAAARTAEQRPTRPGFRSRRRARPGRRLRWRLAGAGAVAAGLVITLTVLLLPGGRHAGSVPAAVAAVARYAQAIPPPTGDQHPQRAAPVQVGHPVTVMAGGQRIVLRTWRLGGTEAVVAVSDHPFPMPAHAQGVSGMGMAWSARLGRLGLYCLNGQTSELVAAPVPAAELAALAARLPLA
jgi:hypothetical protein